MLKDSIGPYPASCKQTSKAWLFGPRHKNGKNLEKTMKKRCPSVHVLCADWQISKAAEGQNVACPTQWVLSKRFMEDSATHFLARHLC